MSALAAAAKWEGGEKFLGGKFLNAPAA